MGLGGWGVFLTKNFLGQVGHFVMLVGMDEGVGVGVWGRRQTIMGFSGP